ncbi:MAG: hypothetical protein IJZ67_06945 [Alistipes sp.]|nr:hypothetical protein [Alistipes sp.]
MAKKFKIDLFDKRHFNNMLKRMKGVEEMFDEAVKEASRAGAASGFNDPERPFCFDDFPAVRRKVDELVKKLHEQVVHTIEEGDHEEWMLSCEKNNELVEAMTRSTSIPKTQITQWKQPNLEALAAFQARKIGGMGLSDRVWNIAEQFKQELELALDIGLGEGKSAADLSRDVRRYLNEPERLFRRVRDKHGVLRLSKAAKAYHPGQGVYRSAYKNALRLTATENNIAYRTADHERWQQLDFVVGIEIRCSNNHPDYDVCDELKGKYPKDFKFTGWHPFCRCHAVPILKTAEEMAADNERIMNGEPLDSKSVNAVTDVPAGFASWIKDNAERIGKSKSQPYFIRDNRGVVDDILNGKTPQIAKPASVVLTPKEQYAQWLKSIGVSVDEKDIVVDGGFIHMQDNQHRDIYEALKPETQEEHDQLWEHKGMGRHKSGGYVQTSNSWLINGDFRKTKVTGVIDSIAEAKLRANGATDDDIATVKLLDKKINEFSLPVPILATRYVDIPALKSLFGFKIKKGDLNYVLSQISGVQSGTALMSDPACMSASTNELQNVFKSILDVKLQIETPAGTPMYFTDNFTESEIVFGRRTKLQYLSSGITYTGRKAHLTIRCRIVK